MIEKDGKSFPIRLSPYDLQYKDYPPGGREFGLTSLSFLAILKVGYFVDRCVVPLRGCGAATVTLDRAERAMVMAMAKNRVHLKIGGSAYTVLTDDAPEYVEELAEELDKEMRSIINENPSLSVTQAAVLTALDKADTCKKSTASSDNLRAQIKDYLEDSARARMEVDVARREIERLNREISSLRERPCGLPGRADL